MSSQHHDDTACREVLARVYHYLDNEIDDDRRALIADHLQQCPPCGHHYERELVVKRLIMRAAPCAQAPESLRVTIKAQITRIRFT